MPAKVQAPFDALIGAFRACSTRMAQLLKAHAGSVEKTPLIKIELSQGKKRRLYLVSPADAVAIEAILERLDGRSSDEDFFDADVFYPHLKDPIKGPATSFYGIRLRHGLTQKQMAEKIGVSQKV